MIFKFLRNMRISSVINQAKFEFRNLSRLESAYVILMAAEQLNTTERSSNLYADIMRSPFKFTSNQCYQVYWDMEPFKFYQEKALKRMESQFRSLGVKVESQPLNHSKMMYLGLLFWLVRVGSFVNMKKMNDANVILRKITKNLTVVDIELAIKKYDDMLQISRSMGDHVVIDIDLLKITSVDLISSITVK